MEETMLFFSAHASPGSISRRFPTHLPTMYLRKREKKKYKGVDVFNGGLCRSALAVIKLRATSDRLDKVVDGLSGLVGTTGRHSLLADRRNL